MLKHLVCGAFLGLLPLSTSAQGFFGTSVTRSSCYSVSSQASRGLWSEYWSARGESPIQGSINSYFDWVEGVEKPAHAALQSALQQNESDKIACLNRADEAKRESEAKRRAELADSKEKANEEFTNTISAIGSAPEKAAERVAKAGASALAGRSDLFAYLRGGAGAASAISSFDDLKKNWSNLSSSERALESFDFGKSVLMRLQPGSARTPQGQLSGVMSSFATDYLTSVNLGAQQDLKNAFASFSGSSSLPTYSGLNLRTGGAMLQSSTTYSEILARAERESIALQMMRGLPASEAMQVAAQERAARERAAWERAERERVAVEQARQAESERQAAYQRQIEYERQAEYDRQVEYEEERENRNAGGDLLLGLTKALVGAYVARETAPVVPDFSPENIPRIEDIPSTYVPSTPTPRRSKASSNPFRYLRDGPPCDLAGRPKYPSC